MTQWGLINERGWAVQALLCPAFSIQAESPPSGENQAKEN